MHFAPLARAHSKNSQWFACRRVERQAHAVRHNRQRLAHAAPPWAMRSQQSGPRLLGDEATRSAYIDIRVRMKKYAKACLPSCRRWAIELSRLGASHDPGAQHSYNAVNAPWQHSEGEAHTPPISIRDAHTPLVLISYGSARPPPCALKYRDALDAQGE